jgi:hypothetical protein
VRDDTSSLYDQKPDSVRNGNAKLISFESYKELGDLMHMNEDIRKRSVQPKPHITMDISQISNNSPNKYINDFGSAGPGVIYGVRSYKKPFYLKKSDYQVRQSKTASQIRSKRGHSRGKQPRQVNPGKHTVVYADNSRGSKRKTDIINNDPDTLFSMMKRLKGNATKEKEQNIKEMNSGIPKFQNKLLQKHSKSSYQFEFFDKRSNFVDELYSSMRSKQKRIDNSKLLKQVQKQSSSLSKVLNKIQNKMPSSCRNDKNIINQTCLNNNNDLGVVNLDVYETYKPSKPKNDSKDSVTDSYYKANEDKTDQAIVITKNIDTSSREEFRKVGLSKKYDTLQRKTPMFVSPEDLFDKIKGIQSTKELLENKQLNSSRNDVERYHNIVQSKTRHHNRAQVLTKVATGNFSN